MTDRRILDISCGDCSKRRSDRPSADSRRDVRRLRPYGSCVSLRCRNRSIRPREVCDVRLGLVRHTPQTLAAGLATNASNVSVCLSRKPILQDARWKYKLQHLKLDVRTYKFNTFAGDVHCRLSLLVHHRAPSERLLIAVNCGGRLFLNLERCAVATKMNELKVKIAWEATLRYQQQQQRVI